MLTADFIWSEIRDRVQFDADRFTWWLKISRKSRVNTKGNLYKRPTKKRLLGGISLRAVRRHHPSELYKMTIPCMVCFMETSEISIRSWCCSGIICLSCLEAHVSSKIEEAVVKIVCPLGNCDSLISEDEIKELVPGEVFEKYQRFKVEIEQNPYIKTCPGCSRIYHHPELAKTEQERDLSLSSEVMKVTCSKCRLVWCFSCQAPWHHALTCKEFCKGDKSLKIWAKNRGQPVRNACRCPKCQVFIQKSSGCDHMSCSR